MSIDTTKSSLCDDIKCCAPETDLLALEPDESLRLQVFVDHGVIREVANGRLALFTRPYPFCEDKPRPPEFFARCPRPIRLDSHLNDADI